MEFRIHSISEAGAGEHVVRICGIVAGHEWAPPPSSAYPYRYIRLPDRGRLLTLLTKESAMAEEKMGGALEIESFTALSKEQVSSIVGVGESASDGTVNWEFTEDAGCCCGGTTVECTIEDQS